MALESEPTNVPFRARIILGSSLALVGQFLGENPYLTHLLFGENPELEQIATEFLEITPPESTPETSENPS